MVAPRVLLCVLLTAVLLPWAVSVPAQEFPGKRITIVVANTPGTTVDTVARLLGAEVARLVNQTVVIENRPGADSIIGFEYVARQAPADGYTLAVVSVSSLAALPATARNLRFDPLVDLPPVIIVGSGRYVVGTSAKSQWKTLRELAAYAKQNPGKLNYGSFGSVVRMQGDSLVRDLGLEMVHVPYAGGAPFLQALVGDEVQLGFMNETAAMGLGEKLRVLAVTGDKRRAPYLDVPTFAELGFPHYQGASVSFNVRAGTPKPVMDKLHEVFARALDSAEIRSRFARLQLEITSDSPELAARKLAEEAKLYLDIAKKP